MTIYLDHAATTPMRAEVLEAMLPLLTSDFGNPSSAHAPGRRARMALDEAHEAVAAALGAQPREIVFTPAARRRRTWPSRGPPGQARPRATGS